MCFERRNEPISVLHFKKHLKNKGFISFFLRSGFGTHYLVAFDCNHFLTALASVNGVFGYEENWNESTETTKSLYFLGVRNNIMLRNFDAENTNKANRDRGTLGRFAG